MNSLSIHWIALAVCIALLVTAIPSVYTLDNGDSSLEAAEVLPSVFLAILARNSAHMLPNFFGYLENLDYPKDRISLWIRTDHNGDNTTAILAEWAENVKLVYKSVDLKSSDEWLYPNIDPFEEHDERFIHVAQLRQEGLEAARRSGADYLFRLDCDNFLVNNRTLRILMDQQRAIVAPMLKSGKDAAYSNFWCGIDSRGYYKRTPDYIPILQGTQVGCIPVPVVHSALLVDLRWAGSERLQHWPALDGFTGPMDKVTHLAYSAKMADLPMHILNTEVFGFMVKPEDYESLDHAAQDFLNFKLENLVDHPPILYSQHISRPPPVKNNLGLDAVFMIGLVRRPERRNRMILSLDELNFNYTLFDAVDGRQLNQSYLDSLGIKYLSGWKDPWGERSMTFGEVSCFLSHHTIWQQMMTEGLDQILILEDDVVFECWKRPIGSHQTGTSCESSGDIQSIIIRNVRISLVQSLLTSSSVQHHK
ncbi:procollagen galactosyltransferase 2-like isoform X2 [Halichondria panicea]|uniref:procollagen galactosyltransferase 2-like isoform X2 n=1 Tax=Halichondria panicea TaxID=6063 RepID=UPI00312B4380